MVVGAGVTATVLRYVERCASGSETKILQNIYDIVYP